MARILSYITAILILHASQYCVAERIHDHDGAPVSHHHHSLSHQHNGDFNQAPQHSDDEKGEGTCFQQIALSQAKTESLAKFTLVPAQDFAGFIYNFLRMTTLKCSSKSALPPSSDSVPDPLPPIFSLEAAPNAPPHSLI